MNSLNLSGIIRPSAREGSMEILFERMNTIESMCSSRFRLEGGLNLSAFYSLVEDSIQIDGIFFSFSFQFLCNFL